MKNKLIAMFISAILVFTLIYLSGVRLDGLRAARVHSFLPKDSILLDQVHYNWGNVYIFDSSETSYSN